MSPDPEELDARAADYVLGLLTIAETDAVRADLAHDVALEKAIARWEELLTPLAAALKPETPPDFLWQRIEAELGVRVAASASITPLPRRPVLKRAGFWQLATGAMALVAAGLALLWLNPATPTAHYAAAIAPTTGPSAGWLAETRADGALVLTALGTADQPTGKSLELWGLPQGATKPVSLGVLPASGSMVVPATALPRDHLQLMVSLESAGGSPTGQPTGPVLYAGSLTRTE
jgi:anti-sigma-K factor RskA